MVTGGVTIVTGDASWPERRFSLVVQLLLKVVVHNSVGPTITQEHQTNVYTCVTSMWYGHKQRSHKKGEVCTNVPDGFHSCVLGVVNSKMVALGGRF